MFPLCVLSKINKNKISDFKTITYLIYKNKLQFKIVGNYCNDVAKIINFCGI